MTAASPPLARSIGTSQDEPGIVLTTLEITVIRLAMADGRSSLRAGDHFLARIFGRLSGKPLANSRLEALRQYVVRLRVDGGPAAASERQTLLNSGYDVRKLEEIGKWVLPTPRRRRRPTWFDAAPRKMLVPG